MTKMGLASAFLVLGILVCNSLTFTDACRSHRIYIGTTNETLSEYLDINGVYTELEHPYNGHPAFAHQSNSAVIYYLEADTFGGYWVIAPELGSEDVGLIVMSNAPSPELVQGTWHAHVGSEWVPLTRFQATCVERDFMACTGGRITLQGINNEENVQANKMGLYEITGTTHMLRPVYKHSGKEEYLFYHHGLWMIGPTVGKGFGSLFVMDYAYRPEFIMQPWTVFNGMYFSVVKDIKVTCEGIVDVDLDEDGDIIQDMDPEESCHNDVCHNGGVCTPGDFSYICHCLTGYFGPHCQHNVDCGEPPSIAHGEVSQMTGRGFLDLAFYRCDLGFQGPQSHGAVCQRDGQWSDPPPCGRGSRKNNQNKTKHLDLLSLKKLLDSFGNSQSPLR